MDYKFPLISNQFSRNHQAGWCTDACFAIDDGDIDTARIYQILQKGSNQQINDYFKKVQRERELLRRVEDRCNLQRQFEQLKVDLDRQKKQIVEEVINEALSTSRSKRLATSVSSFKRDNLNQFRRYKNDKHDAILG